MTALAQPPRAGIEFLDTRPEVRVQDSEYWRLLGYPKDHVPGERALELAAWARKVYAEHGRPWVYVREASLEIAKDTLRLDGVEFASRRLHQHLLRSDARRVMLVAVSAGHECEDHARQLWQEGKPDEYFFLEMYGSAVAEHLVATSSGRCCDLAERDGLMAIPHYSPGYVGWDIADQNRLFELIVRGASRPFPAPWGVLASGMLRPKKSLLAVFGLAARSAAAVAATLPVPCVNCSFSPCQYRRAAYRHAPVQPENVTLSLQPAPPLISPTPLARGTNYSINTRALHKWSQERVRIERLKDGSLSAGFRFDGKTCSSQGRPLAFDYLVSLSPPEDGYTILQMDCRPAPGDDGYAFMCACQGDAASLLRAISSEKPWLKRPLNDVLSQDRVLASSSCCCSADSRAHKWRLALETIHYTLARSGPGVRVPFRAVPASDSP